MIPGFGPDRFRTGRFRTGGALLALALPVVGCGGAGGGSDLPVVRIGELRFTHADLDRFVESRTGLGASLDAALLSTLLDEFAREQLLLLAADEAGVEVSEIQLLAEIGALNRGPGTDAVRTGSEPEPEGAPADAAEGGEAARFRSEVANRLRVDRLIETVVLDGLEVSDEAARLEFETARPFYSRPETVTLSERRFQDRGTADAAAARLEETGAPEDEDAGAGGFFEIGSFRRGDLPDTVEQAVFGLGPGETTEVVETAAGFRIFRVEQRREAAALSFEEVADVVHLAVLEREAAARIEAFVADLRDRHPVIVHTERLRFPYVGLMQE